VEEARGDAGLSPDPRAIRVVNAAVAERDLATVSKLMHPDVVWEHNIGSGTPEEGVYRGRESVVGLLERLLEPWERLRPEPHEIEELGGHRFRVRGDMRAKPRSSDAEIVTPYEQTVQIDRGLIRASRMRTAGESANIALVRKFVHAFNRGDVDTMVAGLDPEVELHEWPAAPGARSFRGPEGARQALAGWFEIWEWMTVEIEDLVDLDDRVLVTLYQRAKGKGSAAEVEIRSFNVYTFRNRKIVELKLFTEREPALEAARLTVNEHEERR
jgi:ketosteroid isomerase-like protein